MKVRTWLSTCSSSSSISTVDYATVLSSQPQPQPPSLLFSSDSSSDTRRGGGGGGGSISSSSSITTTSTLQTNLSLQTLPSVPSLQKISPDDLKLNLTVTHLSLIKSPSPTSSSSHVVNFLSLHNNLLYAASGNSINVFHSTTFTLIDTFNNSSSSSVKSVTFHNKLIFTAHQDCKIRAWQLTQNKRHKLLATLPTLQDRLLRSLFPKNYVNVRRHKKRLWINHNDAVSGLDVTDRFICSISWDKYLKIWGTSDFRCLQSIKAHDDAINAVATATDGTIYTGSADRRIKVWRIPAGERRHALVATLEKHKSAVNALALNGDGSVLFSGACDRSILVWEREDSANHMVVTGALRGHCKAILCLINFSDLLFSGSADRTVRIWQRGHDERYCCLTVLDGHEKPVRSLVAVADDSDGRGGGGGIKVFSGSFDGAIKVWQVVVSSQSSP